MIIFGSRTKSVVVAMLFFACRVCHAQAAQRLVRRRSWFSLFFVPVFPLGHGSYTVNCAYCGTASPLSREDAERFRADAERAQTQHVAQETLPPQQG